MIKIAVLCGGLGLLACGQTNAGKDEAGESGAPGLPAGGTSQADGSGGNAALELPAEGAGIIDLSALAPAPAGKQCPSGAALTVQIPEVTDPLHRLNGSTNRYHVVDGEAGAAVSCTVVGGGSDFLWSGKFSGKVSYAGKSLSITNGVFSEGRGTADISVTDSTHLSGALSSSSPCQIDLGNLSRSQFQADSGSIWAGFSCAAVERAPSDSCAARGVFVLDNCAQ